MGVLHPLSKSMFTSSKVASVICWTVVQGEWGEGVLHPLFKSIFASQQVVCVPETPVMGRFSHKLERALANSHLRRADIVMVFNGADLVFTAKEHIVVSQSFCGEPVFLWRASMSSVAIGTVPAGAPASGVATVSPAGAGLQ